MIYVKAVIGEGYNLVFDEESGHSIVLTNGVSDVVIPVPESSIIDLLRLHKEDMDNTKQETVDRRRMEAHGPPETPEPRMTKVNHPPQAPQAPQGPPPGLDTGEEYTDGDSGVGSI